MNYIHNKWVCARTTYTKSPSNYVFEKKQRSISCASNIVASIIHFFDFQTTSFSYKMKQNHTQYTIYYANLRRTISIHCYAGNPFLLVWKTCVPFWTHCHWSGQKQKFNCRKMIRTSNFIELFKHNVFQPPLRALLQLFGNINQNHILSSCIAITRYKKCRPQHLYPQLPKVFLYHAQCIPSKLMMQIKGTHW